ncbi:MAG: hypothetical protein HRU20_17360 [Pseudomonadales bacterium]|nr:hypothetical protein [Pseudomonadales bacterium]
MGFSQVDAPCGSFVAVFYLNYLLWYLPLQKGVSEAVDAIKEKQSRALLYSQLFLSFLPLLPYGAWGG